MASVQKAGGRYVLAAQKRSVRGINGIRHKVLDFFEAKEQSPQTAGWILRQIRNLYLVERRLRKERAGPKLRQAIRASESRMIHERLGRALIRLKTSGRYLPKSQMGKAINYALGQW